MSSSSVANSPESSMRDRDLREWRALIRERADREWRELSPDVVDELACHLADLHAAALSGGASQAEARHRAVDAAERRCREWLPAGVGSDDADAVARASRRAVRMRHRGRPGSGGRGHARSHPRVPLRGSAPGHGFPVAGDDTYGAKQTKKLADLTGYAAPRVLLHAHKLAFTHPRTKRKKTFTAPWPADFQEALERLRMPA